MKATILIPKGYRKLRVSSVMYSSDMNFESDGIYGYIWCRCWSVNDSKIHRVKHGELVIRIK